MGNNHKAIIIGKLFDLFENKKFYQCTSTQNEVENITTLLFETKYKGKRNWCKIILPYFIHEETALWTEFSIEYIIDGKVIKLSFISEEKLIEIINEIPKQNG